MFTRKIFLVVVTQMRNNKLGTVIEYTDKANERLRRKYYRMTLKNGKKSNVAKTAVAKELACFKRLRAVFCNLSKRFIFNFIKETPQDDV